MSKALELGLDPQKVEAIFKQIVAWASLFKAPNKRRLKAISHNS